VNEKGKPIAIINSVNSCLLHKTRSINEEIKFHDVL
jgi:hypothetical protein